MAQFEKECKEELGADPPAIGSPDQGNGYFGKNLSYGEWLAMQTSNRVQQNFLEWVFVTSFFMGIAACANPLAAIITTSLIVLGRLFYTFGYGCISIGARTPGMLCQMLGALGSIVLTFMVIFGEKKERGVWKTLPL